MPIPTPTPVPRLTPLTANGYSYFPSGVDRDGKTLAICSGAEYSTLSLEPVRFLIGTSSAQLELGIFDADIGGHWDSLTNGKPAGVVAYRLYADRLKTGDRNIAIFLNQWLSTDGGAVDDGWWQIILPNDIQAFDGTQYNYLFEVLQTDQSAVSINNFKVRVMASLHLSPKVVFAFEGAVTGALEHIWPNWPDTSVTTYDGEWLFKLYIGGATQEVSIWDGDMDFGDGSTTWDTDDPNTEPGPPWFSTGGYAVAEGGPGYGRPRDNNPALNGILARGASITYELVDPDGNHYLNENPSGNQEWENFVIRTVGYLPDQPADYRVDAASLPAGEWTAYIHDMDLSNANYFYFEYAVGASAKMIGDTVWQDLNGDGWWQMGTEPGIAGVHMNLYFDEDCDGVLDDAEIARGHLSTQTDSSGYYEFTNLPSACYIVEVAPENSNPGGALYYYDQTQIVVPPDANDANHATPWPVDLRYVDQYLWADFGYYNGPCAGTPGFWGSHPEAWPVQSITIGGRTYTKAQALTWLWTSPRGDMTISMFQHLCAAKLNVLFVGEYRCVNEAIPAADAWMALHPVGTKVTASSSAWQAIEPTYLELDQYNSGESCLPCSR